MWHWHAHLVEAQVMKNVNIDSMINYQGIEKGFFYKGGGFRDAGSAYAACQVGRQ